jgi:hypothetical protein
MSTPSDRDIVIETEPGRTARASRLLRAAGFYFAIVFGVGLLLGPPRALWLEPWLGKTLAVLCEMPFLIGAMWFGARAAPNWAGLRAGWATLLGVGVIALVLQQIADLAVGFGLRSMTLAEQWAYFSTPPGYIYAFSLVLFALMPLLRRQKESGT